MSYVLNPPGGDNVQGDVDPNQIAYGDPDDPGKIKGSNDLTWDQTNKQLTVTGDADNDAVVEIVGSESDVSEGPRLVVKNDTGTPSAIDLSVDNYAVGIVRGGTPGGTMREVMRFGQMSTNEFVTRFNNGGLPADFAVQSDTVTNMFFVDGGQNKVSVGDVPTSGRFQVRGGDVVIGEAEAAGASQGASSYTRGTTAIAHFLASNQSSGDQTAGIRAFADGYRSAGMMVGEMTQPTVDDTIEEQYFFGRQYAKTGTAGISAAPEANGVEYLTVLGKGATDGSSALVINEDGIDMDFRVEGETNGNLIRTNAQIDKVAIGGAPGAADALFSVNSGTSRNALDLISSQADANGGPNLRLFRDSGSPASGDTIGQVGFYGKDDGGNDTEYARISVQVNDETGGTEDGWLRFGASYAGNMQPNLMTIRGDDPSVVINEDSADVDFRVEGQSAQSLLRTNAAQDNVGINTNPLSGLAGAKPMLHVKAEDDNIGILIEDDAADSDMGPEMVLYRSSASPAVNDLIGRIRFEGQDSGGNPHTYFRMSSQIKDPTDASEDGNFFFSSRESGALFDVMKINGASLEINPNTNSNINFNVRTNLTTQAQSFFRTYNNTDIAERYTEVLRGSRTITATPVSITADRCYGSNIVTSTGASVVNLPEAKPGMHLQVVNKNISGISIAPASGDTINGSTSSFSVQHGWVIAKVICIADGEWVVAEAN